MLMVAPRIIQDQQWGTHYKFEWRMDHWIHGEPRTCYELCQQNFFAIFSSNSILDEAERIFFKTLSPMLNFLYITLFWNALEFCGRLGHVPWREVSYHLIALIAGISKKDAPPLIHIKIFLSQAGP